MPNVLVQSRTTEPAKPDFKGIWLYGNFHCIEPGFQDIWCGIFHVGWMKPVWARTRTGRRCAPNNVLLTMYVLQITI